MVSPHEARKNFFHLHFSVVWMGSRSTVVLCTALSLTSAFHVIRDITERKKSTPKARYGKTNPADSWWGSSRTTKHEQLAVSNCMHVYALHSHQLSATTWRPKTGTAKTVPAIPAVPALSPVVQSSSPVRWLYPPWWQCVVVSTIFHTVLYNVLNVFIN